MDTQDIFNAVISIMGAVVGWVLKTIWDTLRDMKQEIRDLTVEVHQDFARRDDFKEAVKEIKDMLYKIFDKLDEKADKNSN